MSHDCPDTAVGFIPSHVHSVIVTAHDQILPTLNGQSLSFDQATKTMTSGCGQTVQY